MKKRVLGFLFTGFLFTAMLFTGCGSAEEKGSNAAAENSTQLQTESGEEGESNTEEEPYVLNFEGKTLAGEMLTSDCFADSKLTMINVWATFCGPCINEMPDLGEIAAEYDTSEFQLIGIISDVIEGSEGETYKEAQEIVAETGADYHHLLLNEGLYVNLVGASDSVPTTYFFNEKGELLGYLIGAQSKETWIQIIDGLLADME